MDYIKANESVTRTLENAIGYAVGKTLLKALEEIKVEENGGFFVYQKSENLEQFFNLDVS